MMRNDTRILRGSVLVLGLVFAAACGETSTPTALAPSVVPSITTPTPTDITAPAPATDPTPAPTPTPAPAPSPAPSSSRLLSLVIVPLSQTGGEPVTGSVTLDGPAPDGGAVITLASNNQDARPPASVNVSAGNRTATVTIPTASVSKDTEVSITASYGGVSKPVQIRLYANGELPGDGGGGGGGGSSLNIPSTVRAFALLGSSGVTCTASTVVGDVGSWPLAAITGFPATCSDAGTIHAADGAAQTAHNDLVNVYNSWTQPCQTLASGLLDGITLAPGVYCVPHAASNINGGTLTLTGSGTHILRFTDTFIMTGGASAISLSGGATCGGVGFQIPVSGTLTGSAIGTFIANTGAVTATNVVLTGRAVTFGTAVTMTNATISNAGCN